MSRSTAALALLLLGLRAGGAPAPLPQLATRDAAGGVLISHGKGYAIHAVPSTPPSVLNWSLFGVRKFPVVPGLAVIHTSTATGKKQVLTGGGEWSYPGPPMGIDRIHHHKARVVGIAATAGHVYVLRWEARATTVAFAFPEPQAPVFDKGRYRLFVFRAADGKALHEVGVNAGSLPAAPPPECSGRGPLRPRAGGVSCFGQAIELRGGKLVKQGPEKASP